MQNIIDYQRTVVLDIMLNYPNAAGKDRAEYAIKYCLLHNLIINLDMDKGK